MILPILLLFAALAPDREPLPDEWGYRPADGERVTLNPPALSWVHEKGAATYAVQWADNAAFRGSTVRTAIPWSVYTHSAPLKPGTWYWRYRVTDATGVASSWSKTRRFVIPADATEFPQPTMDELKRRIPTGHPRLFVRNQDLPTLKSWIEGAGRDAWAKLRARADKALAAEPTSEPAVKASSSDPATNQFWWSNRVQTIRALHEAEALSFVWLLTGERRYGDAARRNILALAAWDLEGPTNFRINCEAAKPMLHRLARAYDWGYEALGEEERARVRAVLLRRAQDAWASGEVRLGVGHLSQPYGSHANRTWHKLAENAVATLGETRESEQFLDYAVTKFFAAYPVWSDDDGGWHEGLSYLGGYMSKTTWWMDLARTPLGIDSFQKPFFRRLADYVMYSAPPGSPELGLADLSFRPPGQGWAFLHYYTRRTGNRQWAWWLDQWKIGPELDEPVLEFLWSALPGVEPQPPAALPPSKIFHGTGVAILNTSLLDSANNVQVRFKSSPMGRWSHGHDPHNAFTLNAYGEALLVNNVYRDLYGTPFHKEWVWSTRAQNAVLVNGEGQKPHSKDAGGSLVRWEFSEGLDYVSGDATPAYEGRLTKALRHVLLVKPDLVIIADELEAPRPSTFQWMLHGQEEFQLAGDKPQLRLNRRKAGVIIDYVAERPVKLRQWTGYTPEPDHRYLESIKSPGIPPQWHVEAATTEAATRAFTLTVARTHRAGQPPAGPLEVVRSGGAVTLRVSGTTVKLSPEGPVLATVTRSGSERVVRR